METLKRSVLLLLILLITLTVYRRRRGHLSKVHELFTENNYFKRYVNKVTGDIVHSFIAIFFPYLSLTGCQGRSPFLPMPRSGHTATIAFTTRDIVVICFPPSLRKWRVLPVTRRVVPRLPPSGGRSATFCCARITDEWLTLQEWWSSRSYFRWFRPFQDDF